MIQKPLRIAVFGTPALAAELFAETLEIPNIEIVVAVTMPDRAVGRGQQIIATPVKQWAAEHNIPVLQPEQLDETFIAELRQYNIDRGLVVAYGKIFRADFLEKIFPLYNIHFSLLPQYRGASPVQSAILDGKKISGVSLFHIDAGMDTGALVSQENVNISRKNTAEVFADMHVVAADILRETFGQSDLIETEQKGRVSKCGKFQKSDGLLVPTEMTSEAALRKILAFSMWPTTWIEQDGKRIKIITAQQSAEKVPAGEFVYREGELLLGFQEDSLKIITLQKEGKKAISGEDFGRTLS